MLQTKIQITMGEAKGKDLVITVVSNFITKSFMKWTQETDLKIKIFYGHFLKFIS